jgi:cytochrome c oxidase subunit 1
VCVHHMFTTGLGPTANSVFAATTMIIAVPTGVKIFNWIGTMVMGQLRFATPMLFAVGLVSQFTIGGLSGVMHASPPVDAHHNDSYFVIAHFHYVLFGGSIFGLLAAIYFWFPKFTGRMMDERLGKINFWMVFIGFNGTFFPMHFLGLEGMPRRYYSYGEGSGWWFWNVVVSLGAFFLAAGILVFLYNVARSLQHGKIAGNNPWDAPTLEWSTSSPPPAYNFAVVPTIHHRDPLWADKYGVHEDEEGVDVTFAGHEVGTIGVPDDTDEADPDRSARAALLQARREEAEAHVHLPNPSFYPFVAAVGMFLVAFGMIIDNPVFQVVDMGIPFVTALGVLLLVGGIYGWSFEPAE